MRTISNIAFILLAAHVSTGISPLKAQKGVHQIIDFVELPAELKIPGDSASFIEFTEQWTFQAKGGLIKEVKGLDLPFPERCTRIKEISYEFMLLDPHLVESANRAFSEPDSMDIPTRQLQADLIGLIESLAPISPRYDPDKQLLSVYFHEEWILDPESREIHKEVKGITPVIWQRRQTADGRSIDEGDSGLPVYYKTPLQKIPLR
jgi:hypothetical protein